MLNARIAAWIVCAATLILCTVVAFGQDYPNKPVRIATGGAGGGSDFTSRQIAQGITAALGQPVIVENRGAGPIIGDFLTKAPPDGYGLAVTGSSFWVGPLLQKVPYDVASDFSPISLISREVNVVAVHPSLPVKSIKELIALAKARPGELNYASSVPGSPNHLAGELFKSMAGVNIVHVMTGMFAPGKTPGIIVNRLNQEVVRFLNRLDTKERFLSSRIEIVGSSPEQFTVTIKSDVAKMSKVIKDAGIKMQ